MVNDDMKEQIPLFELPSVKDEKPSAPASRMTVDAREKEVPDKKKVVKEDIESVSDSKSNSKGRTGRALEKVAMKSPLSGQVPEGDVRLTANIREDLHLKLKIAAARRRTTIGELLEEMVEKYI